MAKSKEKLLAREMRRKGESIREIAKIVEVARSTISTWCRDIELTSEQREVLIRRDSVGGEKGRLIAAELRKAERVSRLEYFANIGLGTVTPPCLHELYLIGLALYWAEGSKKRGRVRLCNSDPRLINIYIVWLERCLNVKRSNLTCRVSMNEEHKYRQEEIEKHWSEVVGIPRSQFTKTTLIQARFKKVYERREEYFGVLDVTVRKSTNLNYQIGGAINGLGSIFDGKIPFEAG